MTSPNCSAPSVSVKMPGQRGPIQISYLYELSLRGYMQDIRTMLSELETDRLRKLIKTLDTEIKHIYDGRQDPFTRLRGLADVVLKTRLKDEAMARLMGGVA
jgi:hypothetical protein